MLVAPNLAPWGPSSDAGGLGSTGKETLGVQAWISIDFGRISVPPFELFWPTLEQKFRFLARSGFLKILGSESGCLGLQNQAFGVGSIAKTAFHRCWDCVDFGVIFTWFSMALGPILMTFGGLGAGLKHYDFLWFSGRVPELRQYGQFQAIWYTS